MIVPQLYASAMPSPNPTPNPAYRCAAPARSGSFRCCCTASSSHHSNLFLCPADALRWSGVARFTVAALFVSTISRLPYCFSQFRLHPALQVRCAGALWLVSLLLHCRRHPRLVPLLPEAQQALSQLLGDQNELTQVHIGFVEGWFCSMGWTQQLLGDQNKPAQMHRGSLRHSFQGCCACKPSRSGNAYCISCNLPVEGLLASPIALCLFTTLRRRWQAAGWPLCTTWQMRPRGRRCWIH